MSQVFLGLVGTMPKATRRVMPDALGYLNIAVAFPVQ